MQVNDQLRYYRYLDSYLNQPNENSGYGKTLAPPSTSSIDPILNNLVSDLITTINQRNNIVKSTSNVSNNIQLRDLDIRISNLKASIKENSESNIANLNQSLKEVDYRISSTTNEIAKLPAKEFRLLNFERKFELNNETINFLLQRRSEAQITMASNTPDYEIIDEAKVLTPYAIAPKTKFNYLVALFLALLLPSGIILLIDLLNKKIRDIDELEAITSLPILGKIIRNPHKEELVIKNHPDSPISETFRSIRSSFQFLTKGEAHQVIVVTSSVSKEGKSFCSLNLANVFALNEQRTVLLEFDLRRPNLMHHFGKSLGIGITSYLSRQVALDDIIINTYHPNLDFIPAGPQAPNTAELISSDAVVEFVALLREMYDIIIIDSAPVGILTETSYLMHQADSNFVVVRLNNTKGDVLKDNLKTIKNNKLDNISILVNDLVPKGSTYSYKYDKNYYHSKTKKRKRRKAS
ncbi:MAG: polysaccharide biosynthesis tyrosine autokinase [Bacteroidales bacterium]|nr:polysaccharide biosynthesis tyrosine autokinase [Bacteroidales bacterium]